jgi:hypothetical protein
MNKLAVFRENIKKATSVTYQIVNTTQNKIIAKNAKIANNYFQRLKGLMFIRGMRGFDSLIFFNAPAIHTCFMRFAIDVVFLNKDNQIIKLVENMSPGKAVNCFQAKTTLELNTGVIDAMNMKINDKLSITPNVDCNCKCDSENSGK